MNTAQILNELEGYSSAATKNTYLRHGAKEPLFGVKVQDLKKIVKKVKKNHELALSLYATGNSDAMYLAGLIADESKISKEELRIWAEQANWYMLSEYTVAWITAESPYALELALEWIDSDVERLEAAGWSTLSNYLLLKPNEELELSFFSDLLDRIEKEIHSAKNRVRYTMNGFIIEVGSSIPTLSQKAQQIGFQIGKINVDVGKTSCKVPYSVDYIQKVIDKGNLGKKRKAARC
jgi:3-methyladenine DNA glycosylase AlkD